MRCILGLPSVKPGKSRFISGTETFPSPLSIIPDPQKVPVWERLYVAVPRNRGFTTPTQVAGTELQLSLIRETAEIPRDSAKKESFNEIALSFRTRSRMCEMCGRRQGKSCARARPAH